MLVQFVAPVAVVLAVATILLVVASPSFRALTKTRSQFVSHPLDPRVFYEPGAERYAQRVASFLPHAVETVETVHGLPYKSPVRVYVCATQRSLNEFIAAPPATPIRGTVAMESVFLAPSAFDWGGVDTHRETLTHELSHLHIRQRLGLVAHRSAVPAWFNEGLANLVAGAGGEGITEEDATEAVLAGRGFEPDTAGAMFRPKGPQSYGLPAPMLQKQATMFLAFIRDTDPSAFDSFLLELQLAKNFAGPFRTHFGMDAREMWMRFEKELGKSG
jgi:hypothetical protein